MSYYDKKPYLDFYLDDPKRTIIDLTLKIEGSDKKINSGYFLIKHNLIRIFTNKVKGKDFYIEILVSNEKSIKNIEFKLENLKLK